MKSLFSKILAIALLFVIASPLVSAGYSPLRNQNNGYYQNDSYYDNSYYNNQYNNQNYYYNQNQASQYQNNNQYRYDNRDDYSGRKSRRTQTYNYQTATTCPNFSGVSVGVGNLFNGVNISIVSSDATLQNCIKNHYWEQYFNRFGNTVLLSITRTTMGVQILATSTEPYVISNLQNGGWPNIINNIVNYTYVAPTPVTYTPPPVVYVPPTYYNNQNNYQYYNSSNYQYRAGSTIFSNSVSRSLTMKTNGVMMMFTTPDYSTMRWLQGYQYSNFFSHLIGVSISVTEIAGGVQVTVTAGNYSTIQEVQNIAYNLVSR